MCFLRGRKLFASSSFASVFLSTIRSEAELFGASTFPVGYQGFVFGKVHKMKVDVSIEWVRSWLHVSYGLDYKHYLNVFVLQRDRSNTYYCG
jgi:hypothetical protein